LYRAVKIPIAFSGVALFSLKSLLNSKEISCAEPHKDITDCRKGNSKIDMAYLFSFDIPKVQLFF